MMKRGEPQRRKERKGNSESRESVGINGAKIGGLREGALSARVTL